MLIIETLANHNLGVTPKADGSCNTLGTTQLVFIGCELAYTPAEDNFKKIVKTRTVRLDFTLESLERLAAYLTPLIASHKRFLGDSDTKHVFADDEPEATEEKPNPPGWTEIEGD